MFEIVRPWIEAAGALLLSIAGGGAALLEVGPVLKPT